MPDLAIVVLAFALLLGGVVGSVTPFVPSGLLSVAGVLLYWWHTGYTEPNVLVLVGLVLVGVTATVVDWLAGVVSAKAGGASTTTAILAGVAGLVGLFTLGPLGLLVGTVGTVFLIEYAEHSDARAGLRTAAITTVGLLGSNVVQVVLTGGILVAMLVVVLV
ncbi:DUF456 domain-containing protein [Haloarculaceae archaeon H-GB2-1]|nr:DUF456 domain-containing protein [Haloarculaceae archaeon H-GB1-1]MEA5408926.1 DUF456 domain-containing protein [Haloarculaceae archaeon H-GB2-1]